MPAPHRGDANKPLKIQGKANAIGEQTRKRRAGNPDQGKANATGKQTNKRRAGNQSKKNTFTPGTPKNTIAKGKKRTLI
ncbi:hypothetical protein [Paraburkholderia sediminicola]|uniref:hypothetical protein n=1 Tax=Paraburkholderia sediminicola TaxID=458836 RepID=UPI0038BB03D8